MLQHLYISYILEQVGFQVSYMQKFLMFVGPQRQVQDRTYFLGALRSKINELQQETANLKAEVNVITEDQSSFVTYEKRYRG